MVRPKKHLGQHFLTDQRIAEKITTSLKNPENVLEVGPGKGVLTNYLTKISDINLKLVELDEESIFHLEQHFPELDIRHEDFLKMDLKEIFNQGQMSVIGNFPYNISTQIVFKILENQIYVNEMVGMFQKEVAERICASPGSKQNGIMSIITQTYFNTTYLFNVKEGAFFPKPKVRSGVIRLTRKESMSEIPYLDLLKFVKMAFNQRRKQLKNTISSYLPEGFDHKYLTKRPEQLSHTDFAKLLKDIKQFGA